MKASRGRRLVAKIADTLLVFVAAALGMYVVGDRGVLFDHPGLNVSALIGMSPVGALQLALLVRTGQTVGKKLLDLRIVGLDGEPANRWRLVVLRSLVPIGIGWIPLVNGTFGLIDALFIFGGQRRCIHDYLAETIVVDLRAPKSAFLRIRA